MGQLQKALITDDNHITLHVRIVGVVLVYSMTLDGKRDGNTIKGTGTVITRGKFDLPLSTRNVTWVAHYAGTR